MHNKLCIIYVLYILYIINYALYIMHYIYYKCIINYAFIVHLGIHQRKQFKCVLHAHF